MAKQTHFKARENDTRAQEQKNEEARSMQERIERETRERKEAEQADIENSAKKLLEEQKEREKLRPISTPITQTTSASKACPNEETVTMVFPRQVVVWTDNKIKVLFPAGIQEVPVSLKDHWYLRANKVELYKKGGGE